jgi:hypothetical protein
VQSASAVSVRERAREVDIVQICFQTGEKSPSAVCGLLCATVSGDFQAKIGNAVAIAIADGASRAVALEQKRLCKSLLNPSLAVCSKFTNYSSHIVHHLSIHMNGDTQQYTETVLDITMHSFQTGL